MAEQNRQVNLSFPMGGLGLFGTLVLFILKVTVYPALSWWWVLCPVGVCLGVPLLVIVTVGLVAFVLLFFVSNWEARMGRREIRRRNEFRKRYMGGRRG